MEQSFLFLQELLLGLPPWKSKLVEVPQNIQFKVQKMFVGFAVLSQ